MTSSPIVSVVSPVQHVTSLRNMRNGINKQINNGSANNKTNCSPVMISQQATC